MSLVQELWPYGGARWWRFDFHTHTPASADWDKHNRIQAPSPEEWLGRYMSAGIDCVAVTDHNSGAWIDLLKQTYERMREVRPAGFREIFLFPGVEISVNGGIHLLAIFSETATTSDIDTILGKLDYQGTKGDSDGVTSKSLQEVVKTVTAAGGIAIPAHADESKGLLQLDGSGKLRTVLDAGTIQQVLDTGLILAMEVCDRAVPKPEIYRAAKCGWTEVLGSDCHEFRGKRIPGSRYTWVKFGRPSLGGLRLALIDGDQFSIRRSDDGDDFNPLELPKHFMVSVEVCEARYMGRGKSEIFHFSPWLNAVVGGRGTGKSTVIHAIRLAYRRDDELSRLPKENEARLTFEGFTREPENRNDESGGLDYRSSRKTEIRVALMRDGVLHRLRWLQSGDPVVEEESEGEWREASSQSITADRFPIRILSQGQIAALAGENQEALLALIDEAANTKRAHLAFREEQNRYFSLRSRIREIEAKIQGRASLDVGLADVQRKLATFEGKQHAEILKAYHHRTRQNREIDRQLDAASRMGAVMVTSAANLSGDDLPEGLFDPTVESDKEALAIVARVHAAVEAAAKAVREAGQGLDEMANRERLGLLSGNWFPAVLDARTKYSQLTQELKQAGAGDPAEYGGLVQERQRLEMEAEKLNALTKELEKLQDASKEQRSAVRAARQAISQGRKEFLGSAIGLNPYVRIELLRYGRDSRSLEVQLRKALGVEAKFEDDILKGGDNSKDSGIVADLLQDLPVDQEQCAALIEKRVAELGDRVRKACDGEGDFGSRFNKFLEKAAAGQPEFLDRFLLWSPEDSLRVEYSPKGDGREFRSIVQGSAGQRAAAMLAFLLAHGEEPLVLDQPEDDLDNHLIYELVVRQIRANKSRRQILVVTHNPNIVVNGDAEMLHALDFAGGQCKVKVKGSLQEDAVREEVCTIMEGGREAFERRHKRLSGETGHV